MERKASVCRELRILNNLIKRQAESMVTAQLGQGITEMQGRIIGFLYCAGDKAVYQKDVEAEFSITRATTSKMLTLMEKNGLVVRSGVRGDRRLKRICLTEDAIAYARQIESGLRSFERQVVGDLTEGEQETLLCLLRQLERNICAESAGKEREVC